MLKAWHESNLGLPALILYKITVILYKNLKILKKTVFIYFLYLTNIYSN